MRRNSLGISKRSLLLASLLALTLTLLLGTVASARTVPAPQRTNDLQPCLTASPLLQKILLGYTAQVEVKVYCPPAATVAYVAVSWGDGTVTKYPLCVDICPLPPRTVNASHLYTSVGDYKPKICVIDPTSSSTIPLCTSVEIIVIAPPPTA